MDALEAAVTVLAESREDLHWTKIQDVALRRGYLDPFETPDVRRELLSALSRGVREGRLVKRSTGVYALAER